MYCPQMMGSIGNGTFLNMLQDNQGLSGMLTTIRDCPDWQLPRIPGGPSTALTVGARPLGWSGGTSQSHPRPGRRTRRAGHRRHYRIDLDLTDGDGKPAKDVPIGDDGRVRRARRRRHLYRPRRRHRQQRHPQWNRARRLGYDESTGIALTRTRKRNTVVVDAVCRFSNTGEGLHRFVDPVDDEVYLYSQFETADAKRMFACFDQPDLKATFDISVTAPVHWEVISNGVLPASNPTATPKSTSSRRHRG